MPLYNFLFCVVSQCSEGWPDTKPPCLCMCPSPSRHYARTRKSFFNACHYRNIKGMELGGLQGSRGLLVL